ncbi:transcription elongation factor GreA [Candidatus Cloacimonadaceae bacterium]
MDLSLFITKAGMEKLQKRINELLSERPEVIKAVAIAREHGDLSENAEYKAARERQRGIDSELDHLRRRAPQLKVVDPSQIPDHAKLGVYFGSYCVAQDLSDGKAETYQVVGAEELNFTFEEGVQAVSIVSPIGKALYQKKPGEIAIVEAPRGRRQLKIIEIK